jgi:hypothetical protein
LQHVSFIVEKKNDRGYGPRMREQVMKAFETYSEGGSIGQALDAINMRRGDFYKVLRADPALKALYLEIQQSRADMMYDESYEISEQALNEGADPRGARVASDIRMKIAAAFDRDRFGDNVKVNIAGTIDLTGALIEAKQRAALPGRNLDTITDAEYETLPSVALASSPDKQSGAHVPAGFVDPFSDD